MWIGNTHMLNKKRARLIAFYLPQYHPIPENDEWWGKGFTEWTNVTKARPLFRGHVQPRLPGELGFYDLRVPEVREQQADLARQHGIEGFCYWHYWLGDGKRLLERPFNEVLESGSPDFPFCLGWANHSWSRTWCGHSGEILAQQLYPGRADYIKHFYALLPAFRDKRWVRVRGKLLFVVFRPHEIPNPREFTELWRELSDKEGLSGFWFVGCDVQDKKRLNEWGFDSTLFQRHRFIEKCKPSSDVMRKIFHTWRKLRCKPSVYLYKDAMEYFVRNQTVESYEYPCIVTNWDSTPRLGVQGLVLKNSAPSLFREHIKDIFNRVHDRDYTDKIIFVKSWNEWAEGNYLEPDQEYGRERLEVLRDEVFFDLGDISK